jgi:hypothetical protein
MVDAEVQKGCIVLVSDVPLMQLLPLQSRLWSASATTAPQANSPVEARSQQMTAFFAKVMVKEDSTVNSPREFHR